MRIRRQFRWSQQEWHDLPYEEKEQLYQWELYRERRFDELLLATQNSEKKADPFIYALQLIARL